MSDIDTLRAEVAALRDSVAELQEVVRELGRMKVARNGTRLTKDWALPIEWSMWAYRQGVPMHRVLLIADQFRDYWLAQPGAKGRKVDWEATWRNWVRRDTGSTQASSTSMDLAANWVQKHGGQHADR